MPAKAEYMRASRKPFLCDSMSPLLSLLAFFVCSCPSMFGQNIKPGDALVDMVVSGPQLRVDPTAYPPAVEAAIRQYLRLSAAYQPQGPVPSAADLRMVYDARVNYERKLAAISDDPEAPKLAREYVTELRPCYEWEGYHDCPEREAKFAEEYQQAHPNGPFSVYLPLLAAHRWLCTSEAYIYENRPLDAKLSRERYETEIALAGKSPLLLARTAAEILVKRDACGP